MAYKSKMHGPTRADYVREIVAALEIDRAVGSSPTLHNDEMATIIETVLDESPHQYNVYEKRIRLAREYGYPQPEKCKKVLRKKQLRALYHAVCEEFDIEAKYDT